MNHTPISPTTANLTVFPRELKIAPTTLLRASTSLFDHFFKTPLLFGDPEAEGSSSPPKTPVIETAIVNMIIERAVSIDSIVIPCSRNKIQTLSAKDASLSGIFSMICLILATYV